MTFRRRFPPPWKIEEHTELFAITDGLGQKLVFIHFEDEPQRRMSMKRLNKDEAWRIARAIIRMPSLMQRD